MTYGTEKYPLQPPDCTCTLLLLFAWCDMSILTHYITADCLVFVSVKVLQQMCYWKHCTRVWSRG